MKVYFSHGFGTWWDDNGLFPDVADSLAEYAPRYVSYNEKNTAGEMAVLPFSEQVRRLEELTLDATSEDVLIAHSQGCIIAGLAKLPRFKKVIFLAPPPSVSRERIMKRIINRKGEHMDNGTWSFPSTTGLTRWITDDYLEELNQVDAIAAYSALAARQTLDIVVAIEDDVLDDTDVSTVINATIHEIHADHNFNGKAARENLMLQIRSILS